MKFFGMSQYSCKDGVCNKLVGLLSSCENGYYSPNGSEGTKL